MAENEIKSINGRKLHDEKARQDIANISVPTKTSELTNDSSFATETFVTNAISNVVIESGNISLKNLEAGEILKISGTSTSLIYGNIVVSKTTTTITEGGTDTFTIMLDKSPTNNQIVNITSSNTDVIVSPTSLTFTKDNYNIEQTVTINVTEDDDHTDDICIITISSPNISNKTLTLTIKDNDEAPNVALESVELPSTLTVKQSKTATLTATILPSDATNKNISWSVDNSNCTVSGTSLNATVTGVNIGNSIITATTEDGLKTATCTVVIDENQSSGDIGNSGLLSYYKANNATASLLPDEQGINDITLTGNPSISDGYITFNTTDKKGICNTLTGFTNEGIGDFTIMICINITNLDGNLVSVGSSNIYSTLGGSEVNWNNIICSNISAEGYEYQVMSIDESPQTGVDVVYTLRKEGNQQFLYLDNNQKATKLVNEKALSSYSKIELMGCAGEIKFKSLAIYNSSLSDDELASNVAIMKGNN